MKAAGSRAVLVGAFALVLGACASGFESASEMSRLQGRQASPFRITRVDLAQADQGRNLFDVISMLRPQFLRGRYGIPTVALNGVIVGPATYLTNLMPGEVDSIELLNGLDATTRFGARHTGAVLVVTSRAR